MNMDIYIPSFIIN